jgi:hypothetical protein
MDEYESLSHSKWSANIMSLSFPSAAEKRCRAGCDRISAMSSASRRCKRKAGLKKAISCWITFI